MTEEELKKTKPDRIKQVLKFLIRKNAYSAGSRKNLRLITSKWEIEEIKQHINSLSNVTKLITIDQTSNHNSIGTSLNGSPTKKTYYTYAWINPEGVEYYEKYYKASDDRIVRFWIMIFAAGTFLILLYSTFFKPSSGESTPPTKQESK